MGGARAGSARIGVRSVAVAAALLLSFGGGSAEANAPLTRPSAGHLIVGQPITLPAALFEAGAAGSASMVTPAQAQTVTRAMWQSWERALITSDTRALSQLVVSGPMLSAVIDRCAVANARCVYETAPRPIRGMQMIVPVQHSYPLYFLAEIRTTDTVNKDNGLVGTERWVEVQILTKSSAQASWKLAFDTGYDGDAGADPPYLPFDQVAAGPTLAGAGQDMYNADAQASPQVPAATFLPLLAAYWQSFKESGHAPAGSQIVSGGYTSGVGQQLTIGRQGSVYLGYRRHYQLSADPAAGRWQFTTGGGYPMVCGSVRDTETDTPLHGLLYQNTDESNWGPPLPPGNYLQIASATEHETCVYVVQGGLSAVGNNTYTSRVSGKPANNALAGLETNFGVLATQIHQYASKLLSCEKAHPDSPACTTAFAQDAEQQFAQFERVLTGTDRFPTRVSGQVAGLAATARTLTLLSEQLFHNPQQAATVMKIEAKEATLAREYDALVRSLS